MDTGGTDGGGGWKKSKEKNNNCINYSQTPPSRSRKWLLIFIVIIIKRPALIFFQAPSPLGLANLCFSDFLTLELFSSNCHNLNISIFLSHTLSLSLIIPSLSPLFSLHQLPLPPLLNKKVALFIVQAKNIASRENGKVYPKCQNYFRSLSLSHSLFLFLQK